MSEHRNDRCCASVVPLVPPAGGSRRRRLWELESHAHCPVIGACLSIDMLRRLVDKAGGGPAVDDDYELHCGVIAECRSRSPLALRVHRALDHRHALPLQRAQRLKTEADLADWWQERSAGPDLPGALWAVLTHPRCGTRLARQVLGEVHMRQHQLGAGSRVDQARLEALADENAVLARELARAQQRVTHQTAEQVQRVQALEHSQLRTRAELITRTTEAALLRERLAALEAAQPDLGTRLALATENRALIGRVQDLQRALALAREPRPGTRPSEPAPPPAAAPPSRVSLADRAVLCVGGRTSAVPRYRQLVERTGGRFLHHDGGAEDSSTRLDATLAAADLVICQTGCISHDAYWRVKDHCKRTGKPCLFVETPSRAALARALAGADTDESTR